jgi:hypothetical protein
MKLSDTDLQKLDTAWALALQSVQKDKLLVVLIDDLKEARERLTANSQNSSLPPRTDAPWTSVPAPVAQTEESKILPSAVEDKPPPDAKAPPKDAQTEKTPHQDSPTTAPSAQASEKRKVGHQKGDPSHGRALTLAVSAIHAHMPRHCAVCQAALDAKDFRPLGGHYVLDITLSANQGLAGLEVARMMRHGKSSH